MDKTEKKRKKPGYESGKAKEKKKLDEEGQKSSLKIRDMFLRRKYPLTLLHITYPLTL